jgi:hypothetical protein
MQRFSVLEPDVKEGGSASCRQVDARQGFIDSEPAAEPHYSTR